MASKKTTALEPARRLSLFEVEAGWIPLLEARIAAETDPELSDERPVCLTCSGMIETCPACDGTGRSKSERERAIEAADLALANHSTTEVEKVDSYIGMIGYLEAAAGVRRAVAQRNTIAARILESMLEQVKATAVFVMTESKRPRLEGSGGYLLAKANGGVAPLMVQDPELVPDDLCKLEGWINAGDFARMLEAARRRSMSPEWRPAASFKRVPDNGAIRAKLTGPCPACAGAGTVVVTADEGVSGVAQKSGASAEEITCPACGGVKTAGVPGARLGDRGVHLEVK